MVLFSGKKEQEVTRATRYQAFMLKNTPKESSHKPP